MLTISEYLLKDTRQLIPVKVTNNGKTISLLAEVTDGNKISEIEVPRSINDIEFYPVTLEDAPHGINPLLYGINTDNIPPEHLQAVLIPKTKSECIRLMKEDYEIISCVLEEAGHIVHILKDGYFILMITNTVMMDNMFT